MLASSFQRRGERVNLTHNQNTASTTSIIPKTQLQLESTTRPVQDSYDVLTPFTFPLSRSSIKNTWKDTRRIQLLESIKGNNQDLRIKLRDKQNWQHPNLSNPQKNTSSIGNIQKGPLRLRTITNQI